MLSWRDVLYLIPLIKRIDNDGFETMVPGDKAKKVFANKKSVRSQEFHMAKQEGITLSYMFEIRTSEYDGEEILKYNDKDYVVYRTYETGEFIELICHRKSESHGT